MARAAVSTPLGLPVSAVPFYLRCVKNGKRRVRKNKATGSLLCLSANAMLSLPNGTHSIVVVAADLGSAQVCFETSAHTNKWQCGRSCVSRREQTQENETRASSLKCLRLCPLSRNTNYHGQHGLKSITCRAIIGKYAVPLGAV